MAGVCGGLGGLEGPGRPEDPGGPRIWRTRETQEAWRLAECYKIRQNLQNFDIFGEKRSQGWRLGPFFGVRNASKSNGLNR